MYLMHNYDNDDYDEERNHFIQEAQQKVWDLWERRFLAHRPQMDDKTKLKIVDIVEDWSGHPFALDIELPPRPHVDIPF